MFFSNGMESTQQTVIHVSPHSVAPFEARMLDALAVCAEHNGTMCARSCRHISEAPETIQNNLTAGRQTGLGEAGKIALAKAPYTMQLNFHEAAVLSRLNSGHKRDLGTRSTSAFTCFHSSQISTIHFNTFRQTLAALALHYHLHQLMLDIPGYVVIHADLSGKLQPRSALRCVVSADG